MYTTYTLVSFIIYLREMKENFENQIAEAKERLDKGALPKKLLEEYAARFDLHHAFFIVTQAQILSKKR